MRHPTFDARLSTTHAFFEFLREHLKNKVTSHQAISYFGAVKLSEKPLICAKIKTNLTSAEKYAFAALKTADSQSKEEFNYQQLINYEDVNKDLTWYWDNLFCGFSKRIYGTLFAYNLSELPQYLKPNTSRLIAQEGR